MDIEKLAGTKLGNYEIESLLGRGGMGIVYKARQVSLNRTVALKILSSDLSSDPSFVKRFKREARAVAKLNHSNIVQIYDIEEADGIHFFSMEYVYGQTLHEILKEEGQLSVEESIKIISQAGTAIKHAHGKSIIHRDLKPHNILLDSDDDVKVMDFGLARITSETTGLTGSGTFLGTVGYMSPEQCLGEELDAQADIYSLGVVLYEMLSGRLPFEEENPVALMHKVTHEDPIDVRITNPEVPQGLSNVISRALARDKNQRYGTVAEFLQDLSNFESVEAEEFSLFEKQLNTRPLSTAKRRISKRRKIFATAAVLVLISCLSIAAFLLRRPSKSSMPSFLKEILDRQTSPSIAVLPFADMSPAKDQEYFCDGMAEEIISALTQLEGLRVIARTSAFSFKDKDLDVREIGRKLNVATVLEGSVRKAGNKLRITVQLVSVSDGSPLWSERYDKEMEDIFAIQDEISLAIVDKLKPSLEGGEKDRLTTRRTADIEAFNLYLRGRWFWNKRTPEGLKKAIEYFEQAIEKDPDYALPYIGLADYYAVLPQYSAFPPQEAFLKAKEAVLKALQIDDTLGEAHASLGYIKMLYDWDWAGAEKEHKRAIELSPGYAAAHLWYGFHLMVTSRFPEAIREIRRAQELDPFSLVIRRSVGVAFRCAGQTDEAIEALKKTIEMDAEFPYTHWALGLAYLEKSMYEEAMAELQREKDLSKTWNPLIEGWIGIAHARMNRTDETQKVLEEFLERSSKEYVPASHVATLYLALGENDQAFEWLNKALQDRDFWLTWLRIEPAFSSVFSTTRFQAFFEKMGPKK